MVYSHREIWANPCVLFDQFEEKEQPNRYRIKWPWAHARSSPAVNTSWARALAAGMFRPAQEQCLHTMIYPDLSTVTRSGNTMNPILGRSSSKVSTKKYNLIAIAILLLLSWNFANMPICYPSRQPRQFSSYRRKVSKGSARLEPTVPPEWHLPSFHDWIDCL